jgi:CheY-like chemotaxis protein
LKTGNIIAGKSVLIVDDEQDVVDTIVELLEGCKIHTASSFSEAKSLLEENQYDIAVLCIMGDKGNELLKVANSQKIPAIILTDQPLSSENIKWAAEGGAAYYATKDWMKHVPSFIADVFEAKDEGKSPWIGMFDRLGIYDKRFHGTAWRDQEKGFWKQKIAKLPRY